jgi:phosphoglycolate phosphatase-like HAD superfamily hydrolase
LKIKKHFILSFDRLIHNSGNVRWDVYGVLFKNYPPEHTQRLWEYLRSHHGVSAQEVIEAFFCRILQQEPTNKEKEMFFDLYLKLIRPSLLELPVVEENVAFIKKHQNSADFAIVSSSSQIEMDLILDFNKLGNLFTDIIGAPMPRAAAVAELIARRAWKKQECVIVGPSLNALECARLNELDFIALQSDLFDWSTLEGIKTIYNLQGLEPCC